MRVLVLSNLYPPHYLGGYELRCRDVVEGLNRRGHSVLVLTSRYGVGKPVEDGSILRVLHSRWDPPHAIPSRSQLVRAELYDNFQLRKIIARFKPHIISVWNMLLVSHSLVQTAIRSRVPVLLHIDDDWVLHGDPWMNLWNGSGGRTARLVKNLVRPCVDFLIPTRKVKDSPFKGVFVSHYRKQRHLHAGLRVHDAPVIYGGIPVDRFQGTRFEQFSVSSPPIRLLFVGVLTPEKGPHLAVQALDHLSGQGRKNVTLTIVGPPVQPAYHQKLRDLVVAKGLQQNVTFLGSVDRTRVPEIYRDHDVFLFTSTASEGFPLTILEAMASGLVVVSSVNGGQEEILKDEENALTYRCGDSLHLAKQITRLLDDPSQARRLAECGHRLVHRDFTVEVMVDHHERLFFAQYSPKGRPPLPVQNMSSVISHDSLR